MSYAAFFFRNKIQRRFFPKLYRRWWNRSFGKALDMAIDQEPFPTRKESVKEEANDPEYVLEPEGLVTLTRMVIQLVENDYDIDKGPASVQDAASFLVGRSDEWEDLSQTEIAILLVFAIENWQKIKSDTQKILEEHAEDE